MSALSERALPEREDAAINAINAVLGIILLISPWLFGLRAIPLAGWNALFSGVVVAAVAFAAFTRPLEWEEWINLVIGLWLIISPWLLGFARANSALWTHVIIGLMVAALAAFELRRLHGRPPAEAA
jgi:uncharacterized membrane protein HdeD (DUF308 family)